MHHQGTVVVGATPRRVCFIDWRAESATITNLGVAPVFLGDASVSANGANAKHELAAGDAVSILESGPVYGAAANGTSTVWFRVADIDD